MPWWVGRWQLFAVGASAATGQVVVGLAGADTGLPWWLWLLIALSSGAGAVTEFRDARRHRPQRSSPVEDST